jgi:hypothetical protein
VLGLAFALGAPWSVLIEITPTRVEMARCDGWDAAEAIDLD